MTLQGEPAQRQQTPPPRCLCTCLLSLPSFGYQLSNSTGSIVGGALALCIPFYYIMHSDKPAGSGQAEIKEARREKGTANEFRDPRDSDVKTLEQKKAKESR
jgi:hypothetical protein